METVFILLVAIAIGFLFLYYVVTTIKDIRKYRNIPGAETNDGIFGFFFGHVRVVSKRREQGIIFPEQTYQDFKALKKKTIKYRVFNTTLVFTQDQKIIKTVLVDQNCKKDSKAYKSVAFPLGERFLGNGLTTELDNEKWKHQRALFNPGFYKEALKSFMKEFNTKIDVLMEHLRTIADSKNNQISLLEKFNRTGLDVIASVAFGLQFDSLNDPDNILNKCIFESLAGTQKYFADPLVRLKVHKWPEVSRFRHSIKYLRNIGREQIEKRLEIIKNGEPLPDDILTIILKTHENHEVSIENFVDNFVTIFIAGQETTANSLASAFMELGRHPEIFEKVRNEVDTVLGSKHQIEYEDLTKLKYIDCVFKEALRLYPAIPYIYRNTDEDIVSDENFIIPKNTWIGLSMYACGRDEKYFSDPFTFNPDRFMNQTNFTQNYTYFPFSLGVRNCIGQNFARIEAKMLIAKFVQKFDFELDKTQSFALYQALTLRPKDGTKGSIRFRK